jgi:crotonobetainyl-CoA:carnitine CoA-transferase CaiB-like acyl-CoA transferase
MILSDLGAEVIKIEPLGGEETRKHPPMVRGQSVYFTVYNRGKKSVCLDCKRRQGGVFDLLKTADFVLENFAPARWRRWAWPDGSSRSRRHHPHPPHRLHRLHKDRPSFDPLGQAMSGLRRHRQAFAARWQCFRW